MHQAVCIVAEGRGDGNPCQISRPSEQRLTADGAAAILARTISHLYEKRPPLSETPAPFAIPDALVRPHAAYYRHPDAGFLIVAGDDRIDFLNRQTSNDVRGLALDRAVVTVLTSPTARIEDVLWLVELPEGIGAMTLPGRGPRTGRTLRGKIFFMDRVTLSDASADYGQIDLEGPAAASVLESLGLPTPPTTGEVVMFALGDATVRVVGGTGTSTSRYRLLTSAAAAGTLAEALVRAGATELIPAASEVWRIEAGRPGPQGELTDEFNPLEAHLDEAISHSKGCYTGQEIIARQVTYDKVTRQLVGLRLVHPAAPGARLLQGAKVVGELTSAVVSPQFGPIALAYVKRPSSEPGTVLTVDAGGSEIAATVVALPFA